MVQFDLGVTSGQRGGQNVLYTLHDNMPKSHRRTVAMSGAFSVLIAA